MRGNAIPGGDSERLQTDGDDGDEAGCAEKPREQSPDRQHGGARPEGKVREGGQDGADDGEGEQNAAPLLAHDARKLGQDKDAEAPAEHLDRKPPRGLDPAHVRRSGDVGKKPQAGRRDRDAEADRYGQSAGNPREQEGAEEKGEQGEGEGARPAETPGAVGVGEAVAAGRHGSEQGRGGGRCREWGSVLYCDEQGRRAGNEGKPGEPAADDGAPTTGRQRGGPDERGRGEEFDEKKKHPASLIRWVFVGTICMTAYSLKSALSNGFLLGSVFGLLECVVITPRYKKRKNIFSECCRQSRDPC